MRGALSSPGFWERRSGAGALAQLPQDGQAIGAVIFALSAAAPPETWAKDVEVWVSADPEDPGGVLAGRWSLAPTTEPPVFAFPRTTVRAVRLRVLTNQGRAASSSLAEFALLPAGG